jgi:iron complex transport system substrate-binding protein
VIVLAVLATACGRDGGPPVPAGDPGPARRIVTLAPHLAEIVFAAGAGEHLVGVVEYSNFPPEAKVLPRVGDAFRVDYEVIAALHPDLVLAWTSGNPPETVQKLRRTGFRVVALEPATLADIAGHIAEVGALAGTSAAANAAATRFRARLAAIEARPRPVARPRVFVQLAERPWFTVTDRHFLGQALRLCGADNVFGDLPGLTAIVSLEAIIETAPEVIVASDMGGAAPSPLVAWQAWRDVPAVRSGRTYTLDADLLSRPSARILDGAEALCGLVVPAAGTG